MRGVALLLWALVPGLAQAETTLSAPSATPEEEGVVSSDLPPTPLFTSRDHWQERAGFDRAIDLSDHVKLEFETNVVDLRQRLSDRRRHLDLDSLRRWERSTVGDARLKLGVLDERLQLTSRIGWSRYAGEQSVAEAVRQSSLMPEGFGFDRYFPRDGDEGLAMLHDLQGSLWQAGPFELKGFARYEQTDPQFVSLGSLSKKNARGEFGGSQGERYEYGGSLRWSALTLAVSQRSERRWTGEELDSLGPARRDTKVAATLSLYGLRERARGALGGVAGSLLPGSVWMSYSQGTIDSRAGTGIRDGIQDLGFGLWWDVGASSFGFSYWRSVYDSRQPGAEASDWIGEGAYLSYAHYAEHWDVYASGGVGRYDNRDPWSQSLDLAFDGSVALWLRPAGLPDIGANLSYGRYQTDYVAYAATSDTQALGLGASLDFTKYLREPSEGPRPRLLAIYRFAAVSTRDGFTGSERGSDHTALLLVQMGF